MLRESDAVTKGVLLKRKVKEAGGVACVPTKKVRLELMSPKLKRVGGSAEQKTAAARHTLAYSQAFILTHHIKSPRLTKARRLMTRKQGL